MNTKSLETVAGSVELPNTLNEEGFAKNSMPVPKDQIPTPGYDRYCCDSRRSVCDYVVSYQNRAYCTYKPKLKLVK